MRNTDSALPFGAQSAHRGRCPPVGRLTVGGKGFVTADEHTLELLDAERAALARSAYLEGGKAAFDHPRRAAALHAAGHAIVAAILGFTVPRCSVARRYDQGRGWLGRAAYSDFTLTVGPDSDPYEDLIGARVILAGLAAEVLDTANYRHGSSLDDLALFRLLVAMAANKLDYTPTGLESALRCEVYGMLAKFRAEHERIAEGLERRWMLGGAELRGVLEPVTEAAKSITYMQFLCAA